jgi:hypothetical protein
LQVQLRPVVKAVLSLSTDNSGWPQISHCQLSKRRKFSFHIRWITAEGMKEKIKRPLREDTQYERVGIDTCREE